MDQEIERLVEQELMPQARSEAWRVFSSAPTQLDRDELVALAYAGLAMAAAAWPDYCLAPDTPVLTTALHWVPIGDLQPDDELVGVEELPGVHQHPRVYRAARVLEVARRLARCMVLRMEDGRSVTCSVDHPWLAYHRLERSAARYNWLPAQVLTPGMGIASPLRVWPDEHDFSAGWLSGMYDGEGHVVKSRGFPLGIGIAQNQGRVLEAIKSHLQARDIPFSMETRKSGCGVLVVNQRWAALELLGRLHPLRLESRGFWEGRSISRNSSANYAVVESIDMLGTQEVVTLETSTGTFLAAGLVSHNCARNGYDDKAYNYFAAYARRRMKGAILDALRSQDWVSRSVRNRAKLLRAVDPADTKSEAELSEETGLTVDQIRSTVAGVARRPVSMDAEPVDVAEDVGVEDQVLVRAILAAAVAELERLPEETQIVVALRYHQGKDLKEIAELLNRTMDEVSAMHASGIVAVREAMAAAATG